MPNDPMLEGLTDELRRYCRDHALPAMSADELAAEISAVLDGVDSDFVAHPDLPERRAELQAAHGWLVDFCARWEVGEECQRTGHTDTGRGVCADCGTFLVD